MTTPFNINEEPEQKKVAQFHVSDDLNSRPEAHHHDLGQSRNQASPGSHTHDGITSPLLLTGTITGSKTTNVPSILSQIMAELAKIGLTDATS
jgi:hypothetical protein